MTNDQQDTDEYSVAAEQLATKLLEFAHAKPNGRVIDLAHGAGESLGMPSTVFESTPCSVADLQPYTLLRHHRRQAAHLFAKSFKCARSSCSVHHTSLCTKNT